MEYVKLIKLLVVVLPDIVRLIKQIQQDGDKKKLQEDLRAIQDAFKTRDADALNRHFNRM